MLVAAKDRPDSLTLHSETPVIEKLGGEPSLDVQGAPHIRTAKTFLAAKEQL